MKKVARVRASKTLRLAAQERVWVGVDTHRNSYHVGVWSEQRGGIIATWCQPAVPAKLSARLLAHRGHIMNIVYEAGPTGFGLARHLQAAGLPLHVIAPSHTPMPAAPQPKSDRLDCCRLAEYAAKQMLRPICIPTAQQEAGRQIMRVRDQMIDKRRKAKQQIKSFLLQHGIAEPAGLAHWSDTAVAQLRVIKTSPELRWSLDLLLEALDSAERWVQKATCRVRALARAAGHAAGVHLLESTPGVGLITAMTYRTELFAAQRFTNQRQVARMIGLAPDVRSSGQTRREGHLLAGGNRRVRSVLVEASWRWIACDERAAQVYRRMLSNTGNAKKAIVAMARKLAIILWRMSVTGEVYRAAA